jgi:hypothetical protein
MRKALIGLILAATVMTPVAAEAQNWRGRGEQGQDEGGNGETRAARIEQRHEERQARQVQQAPQQQVQQAPQVQVVQRQRGDGGNRGSWRGNDGGTRGSWRGNDGGSRSSRGGDSSGSNFQSNNNNNNGNWRGRDRGTQGSIYPQAWQGNPNDPQLRHYQELERRNQQRYGNDRRGDGRNWRNDNRGDNRDWRDGNRRGRNWNRNWRNDNRYDWQRYRYSNRNIFRIGPYYSPYRGYGYNRFSIGVFLDPFFYDQRYWIGDPWQYRLPPAEPGTEWVRYYNDVLLVDVYTGEVLDTIYDFFW